MEFNDNFFRANSQSFVFQENFENSGLPKQPKIISHKANNLSEYTSKDRLSVGIEQPRVSIPRIKDSSPIQFKQGDSDLGTKTNSYVQSQPTRIDLKTQLQSPSKEYLMQDRNPVVRNQKKNDFDINFQSIESEQYQYKGYDSINNFKYNDKPKVTQNQKFESNQSEYMKSISQTQNNQKEIIFENQQLNTQNLNLQSQIKALKKEISFWQTTQTKAAKDGGKDNFLAVENVSLKKEIVQKQDEINGLKIKIQSLELKAMSLNQELDSANYKVESMGKNSENFQNLMQDFHKKQFEMEKNFDLQRNKIMNDFQQRQDKQQQAFKLQQDASKEEILRLQTLIKTEQSKVDKVKHEQDNQIKSHSEEVFKLEQEVIGLRNVKNQIYEKEKHIENIVEEYKKLQSQFQKMKTENDHQTHMIDQYRHQMEDDRMVLDHRAAQNQQLEQKVQQQLMELTEQNNQLVMVQQDSQQFKFQNKTLKNQLEEQILNSTEIRQQLESLQSRAMNYEEKIQILIEENEKINEQLSTTTNKSEEQQVLIQQTVYDYKKKEQSLLRDIENLKQVITQTKHDNQMLTKKCQTIEQFSSTLKHSLETWKHEYQTISQQLGELLPFKSQHKDLQQQIEMQKKEIQRLCEQLNIGENQDSSFNSRISQLKINDTSSPFRPKNNFDMDIQIQKDQNILKEYDQYIKK